MKRTLDILEATGCCPPGPTAPPAEDDSRLRRPVQGARRSHATRDRPPARGADEVCVCHLVPDAGLSQPTISHHLRLLRDAGLVTSERRGTWAYYRLVPDAMADLAGALASLAVEPVPAG